MWNCEGKKLGKYEPTSHDPIDGYLAATIVDRAPGEKVIVHLPDGENVAIDEWRLVERPEEVGVALALSFA